MSEGRTTQATYNGRTYDIPEIWLAGYCATHLDGSRASLMDAVAWWAWQEELKEQANA